MVKSKDNIVDFRQRTESSQKALERLFREHGAALRTFLLGRMGESPDIDDIVQEVFIRLSKVADLSDRLSPGRSDNRAYIFSIANHLVVDLSRYNAVRHKYQESEKGRACELHSGPTPELQAQDHQLLKEVEKTLSKLPKKWRQAFVLSRFEYLSHKEIGEKLGLETRSVERYIGRALVRIRKATARFGENKS